jgi:hypothetical protein
MGRACGTKGTEQQYLEELGEKIWGSMSLRKRELIRQDNIKVYLKKCDSV